MSKEIVERYDELVRQSSSSRLSESLASLLLIAKTIRNERLERWLRLELHGYVQSNEALTEDVEVPPYRTVGGQYSDEYGRPLVLKDPNSTFINEDRLRQSSHESGDPPCGQASRLDLARGSSLRGTVCPNPEAEGLSGRWPRPWPR